ncbi:MAG: hypothetical protein WCE32_18420, partial [Pseudolabrys sp.]
TKAISIFSTYGPTWRCSKALWAYMALFEGADVSRSTIQSELAGLVINQNAMRLLRAFSKINRTSSQRALVTLAEHMAGEH